MRPFGLYIHWPFCLSKCPYCDFNSHVREGVDQKKWRAALLQDLLSAASQKPQAPLQSIFFGGGTPSLMEPETVERLIHSAKSLFTPLESLEITLEANPSSVDADKFKAFAQAGVTRLSIGTQSLNDEALSFLGRRHSAAEAIHALEIAASYFPRFSFDLIYARPTQTLTSWKEELTRALPYTRGHLSLYQLTIEPQTAFATRVARGERMTPSNDFAASLYELTESIMTEANLPSYEISNYACPGQESLHNLLYWNAEDYIGIGPGAHGRVTLDQKKFSTRCYKAPETWLKAVETQGHGVDLTEALTSEERLLEVTLMGLRLTKGLSLDRLYTETGLHPEEAYPGLSTLKKEGLLSQTPTHLALSFEGRLCLNSVLQQLFKN